MPGLRPCPTYQISDRWQYPLDGNYFFLTLSENPLGRLRKIIIINCWKVEIETIVSGYELFRWFWIRPSVFESTVGTRIQILIQLYPILSVMCGDWPADREVGLEGVVGDWPADREVELEGVVGGELHRALLTHKEPGVGGQGIHCLLFMYFFL